MEAFSAGQKKKVLLAASLCQPAHLYVWDEPLNFVDLHTPAPDYLPAPASPTHHALCGA